MRLRCRPERLLLKFNSLAAQIFLVSSKNGVEVELKKLLVLVKFFAWVKLVRFKLLNL